MDSLFNILQNKAFSEPPEADRLKRYVLDNYGVTIGVQVREKDIVLIVPNSAAAGSLRLQGPKIRRELKIDKRLSFRING